MAILLPAPLTGPPPAEVPLPRAPLVRVLAQLRFPPILAIAKPDAVAGFQEAIRSDYPLLEEEQGHMVVLGGGDPEVKKEVIWRFSDIDSQWRVSLAPNFVALETLKYTSRRSFVDRLTTLFGAAEKSFNPQQAQRLGLRYIDQLTGEALTDIARLIRPEVRGIVDSPLGRAAQRFMSDARFQVNGASIQARWGNLPENSTIDPNVLDPIGEPSWILDIDMYTTAPSKFATAELASTAEDFAESIYRVFRWMVTDDFLRFYGGKP